ncbi:MAG: thiolase family protein [Planctomycetes bacterium]|nr:thiolase family protein [Planctomycetota bacterium]
MDVPVVVLGGVRTPFAKAGSALRHVAPLDLARFVLRETLDRAAFDPDLVDEVIMWTGAPPAEAPNIARSAAILAGVPERVPAYTVQRNCASGMEAIAQAADLIASGRARAVLAGGVESMSRIPIYFPDATSDLLVRLARARNAAGKARAVLAFRPRHFKPTPALLLGLRDPNCGLSMGETAERLAQEFGITREEQDRFSLESHRRAIAARKAGRLRDETMPLYPPGRETEPVVDDVGPREDTSLDALARLKPVYARALGTVTAGNSSPITDGAAAILLAREDLARALGIRPLGRILAHAEAGLAPSRMGLGPAFATARLLERAGLRISDFARIEINEAFAAQVLAVMKAFASQSFAERELGRSEALGEIAPDRLNPNGGAIALGHPIGASGARLVLTLLHELGRTGGGRGLATLCVGGGQGSAIAVEGSVR